MRVPVQDSRLRRLSSNLATNQRTAPRVEPLDLDGLAFPDAMTAIQDKVNELIAAQQTGQLMEQEP